MSDIGDNFPEKAWATDFSRFVSGHPEFLNYSTYQEMAYSIHISLKSKIVYFEVPKNASTSVKTLLHQIEYGDPDYVHSSSADLHSRDFSPLLTPFQVKDFDAIIKDPKFLKFTIFRDPLERLLSGWKDKVVTWGHYHSEIRAGTGTTGTQHPSFKEFLYWIAGQRVSDMDLHWKPQFLQSYLFAIPEMAVFSMDIVEDLNQAIQSHIGTERFSLKRIAPHITESKSVVAEHFDPYSEQLVRRKYADDFAVWRRINDGGGRV